MLLRLFSQIALSPSRGRVAVLAGLVLLASPAAAQVQAVDPDKAIDGDLMPSPQTSSASSPAAQAPTISVDSAFPGGTVPAEAAAVPAAPAASGAAAVPANGQTFHKDDLIGAAEGVFGKGAQGLAGIIEDLLGKQGEPNGYIVGREASGAFVVGLRYGSGTLYHKIEGQMPVYWTGPSIGLDVGANAANTFVLVYNLHDTGALYRKRFAAGEGQAYLIGGFHVSYLRRDNMVLIPVRAGAGLRLGLNAGYMKFSRKQKWLPL